MRSERGWENAALCAKLREQVGQLATSHWSDALRIASEIPLVWYRVQSLAMVAAAAADDRVDELLARALSEAGTDTDEYRRTAVLAWIIDAALTRDRAGIAGHVLRIALGQMLKVTPMKSRAAALECLLERATKMGAREARDVAEALLDVAAVLAADPVKQWHKWGLSYINRTASILGKPRIQLAEELLTARFGSEKCAKIIARHIELTGR